MRSRRNARTAARNRGQSGRRKAGEQAPAQRRTSTTAPPPRAAALYGLPPDEFAPAREALARELAAAGDPQAAAVRKLRRPVGLAWLLNHLALAEQERVGTLLRAGDQLRGFHTAALEGHGAGPLRDAEHDVREAARALRLAAGPVIARAGRPAAAAVMARLEVLLRALATAAGDVRERFEKGLLEREPAVGGETFAVFGAPGSRAERPPWEARAATPPPWRTEGTSGRDERVHRREGELARRRAEQVRRREEAAARARTRERAKVRARAVRELAHAEQALERRRAAFDEVQRQLDGARAELESAEGEAKRRRELLDRLDGGPF